MVHLTDFMITTMRFTLLSKPAIILCLLTTITSCRISSVIPVKAGIDAINPILLKKHVYFLASDSLKGRNTPSPALDSAAAYIAGNFKSSGLKTPYIDYLQQFQLCITDLGDTNKLVIALNSEKKEFNLKKDYTPFEQTADKSANSNLVFAGYGITSHDDDYDDYLGIDVKGKIVLIFRNEPMKSDTMTSFHSSENGSYSKLTQKIENAIAHGAAGLLVVNEPLRHNVLRATGFPWPSLSKIIPASALPLTLCEADENKIPVVQIGEGVVNYLFGSVDSLKNIQARIDNSLKPFSFPLEGCNVYLKTAIKKTYKNTQNVVAYIEGRDSLLKNEIVIIGAHYDHVGCQDLLNKDGDSIFNGADDNASGTAGMMSVATAFSKMPAKPKRSVAFVAFAAEEKGLFGSSYFVDHPVFTGKKIVAMINLDMIGRNDDKTVYIVGAKQSPDIYNIVTQENRLTHFKLKKDESVMIGGSDHYNFYKNGIPFIFLFSGLHEQYHQPGDQAELINFEKASKVARLAFLTAWRISNDNSYYQLIKSNDY